MELSEPCAAGMRRWLLVRYDAKDPDEHASFLAYGPEGTAIAELIRVCTTRWQNEEGFAQTTGEVGLDQDEVRTWEAWHRHATRSLLAHASIARDANGIRHVGVGRHAAPTLVCHWRLVTYP